ncbi:hypothetical protein PR202_gb00344 [Eleusine coracana subsp. coracana]|uniref:Phosphoribosyltransferase C-terminal domain-containing protein n=1 Tax=Eleusine coracana subsp. coracana TaxID=191504 RepID=A0AAV5DRB1_ELECO|nr:hypothetical protein PR202_gb00344 [Eleusine coracana subsp. coracana]
MFILSCLCSRFACRNNQSCAWCNGCGVGSCLIQTGSSTPSLQIRVYPPTSRKIGPHLHHIINSLHPIFQEQYSWDVYDTATILTVGVFDNPLVKFSSERYTGVSIGKVRIPLSDLQPGWIYSHAYSLLILKSSGVKQMGKLFLLVKFTSRSLVDVLRMYKSPNLPKIYYHHPLLMSVKYQLQYQEVQFLVSRLSWLETPLSKEVVEYMCDVQSNVWSFRKARINCYRIMSVLSVFTTFWKWFCNVCSWNNPSATLLVHIVFLLALVLHQFIVPLLLLYAFTVTIWNYRWRPAYPSHIDVKICLLDTVHPDELDEKFDTFPTSRSIDLVRMRYDRLGTIACRTDRVIGDVASCGERITALTTWRDPTATTIFGLLYFSSSYCAVFYTMENSCCNTSALHNEAPQTSMEDTVIYWEFLLAIAT